MRRCDAAVLITCGWFLLSPPLMPDSGVSDPNPAFDTSRPISAWMHMRSFDSADECERFKIKLARVPEAVLRKSAPVARCVPSDFNR